VTVLLGAPTYTLVEKLFYSAIADFSAMLTSDTARTFKSLMIAVHKSIAGPIGNMSWIHQTYNAMRRFARCQWSPLAVPLPFASTYKQREILGCTRREEVKQLHSFSIRFLQFHFYVITIATPIFFGEIKKTIIALRCAMLWQICLSH